MHIYRHVPFILHTDTYTSIGCTRTYFCRTLTGRCCRLVGFLCLFTLRPLSLYLLSGLFFRFFVFLRLSSRTTFRRNLIRRKKYVSAAMFLIQEKRSSEASSPRGLLLALQQLSQTASACRSLQKSHALARASLRAYVRTCARQNA